MSDVGINGNGIVLAIALIFVAVAIASFAIGSIPFGYVIGRFVYRTDIRKSGSGNIGAMNALRTIGTGGAIAVLLLDAAKGAIPVLLCGYLFNHIGNGFGEITQSIAATCAVLGHCFSPWLRFKGGKGVATSFGAIFAMSWPAGLLVVLGWVIGALVITRFSSVGSMLANIVAPFALFLFTRSSPLTAYGVFAALFIIWTHRENLQRLRTGTENRISLSRKAS